MNLKNDCLFCKILRGQIPCDKVYEDDKVLAFNDINPQAPVHVLIIPKNHIERVTDITEEKSCVNDLVLAANKIAREKGIDKNGFRLVFNCNKDAGQEVFHIHLHLLGGRAMHWPPG
ncbi:histidine triad nucleotide-binding protein [bacterium]|nr:histidine triad nucleotide-binding protein [bacterium]